MDISMCGEHLASAWHIVSNAAVVPAIPNIILEIEGHSYWHVLFVMCVFRTSAPAP